MLSYLFSTEGGAAGAYVTGIYRSDHRMFSTADTSLGADFVAAIGANTGADKTVTFSTSGWTPET